eukprot:gnl/TRDRNA2_/TRDRNA2_181799_c0_seq1.p1 gnl/TRDRNA2_/TRDRNA2_181799_c0~~gnl/TRDRNA2_/TRDRNA2_181799_c0_seq1.p1  ORF type:complete len:540 (+),score=68.83 gnl/TRDRNA2_/TRDRNA2_181799_c0_seq1:56-1675(+)
MTISSVPLLALCLCAVAAGECSVADGPSGDHDVDWASLVQIRLDASKRMATEAETSKNEIGEPSHVEATEPGSGAHRLSQMVEIAEGGVRNFALATYPAEQYEPEKGVICFISKDRASGQTPLKCKLIRLQGLWIQAHIEGTQVEEVDERVTPSMAWLDQAAGRTVVCYKPRYGVVAMISCNTVTAPVALMHIQTPKVLTASTPAAGAEVVASELSSNAAVVCYLDENKYALCKVYLCSAAGTCSFSEGAEAINPHKSSSIRVTKMAENTVLACCRAEASGHGICKVFKWMGSSDPWGRDSGNEGNQYIFNNDARNIELVRLTDYKAAVCFNNRLGTPESRMLCHALIIGSDHTSLGDTTPRQVDLVDAGQRYAVGLGALNDGTALLCAPGWRGTNHPPSCGPLTLQETLNSPSDTPRLNFGESSHAMIAGLSVASQPTNIVVRKVSAEHDRMLLCYIPGEDSIRCHVVCQSSLSCNHVVQTTSPMPGLAPVYDSIPAGQFQSQRDCCARNVPFLGPLWCFASDYWSSGSSMSMGLSHL